MSAGQAYHAAGFTSLLAFHGESVEFGGNTLTALVEYPDNEAPMVESGYEDVSLVSLTFARAALTTIPARRSYTTFNGVEHEVMGTRVLPWSVTVQLASRA
jgi:hypothetical protein